MPDSTRRIDRLIPRERLLRVIGRSSGDRSLPPGVKALVFFGALGLLAMLAAWLDPRPSLRHVNVAVLSGAPSGNYFATVNKVANEAARRKGRAANLTSAGSVENVRRLIEARDTCDVHFALVQDGVDYPERHPLELIGRLPRPESLIVLGRDADAIRTPRDLRGLRLGIGPVGSGTEQLMRRVLHPLDGLDLKVSTQPIDQQLDMLERGDLDLGAMVIDDEAAIVAEAVGKRRLQILDLPEAAALARRVPAARPGRIAAGQIDYVRNLPPKDKEVLQVDTLVVGNGCASNGATQGLMTALAEVYPTFIAENKGRPNLTGLPMSAVAKGFFHDEGPDLLGTYLPKAVDIMPLPTWIQLGVAVSVLFSAMALWHRFRLWRIDADRVKIESDVPALFGHGVTVGEIADMTPEPRHATPAARAELDAVLLRLSALGERCRKQSLSVLVPMGQEMAYRYQETLIQDLLHALRIYRQKLRS
jgi:hypothetical protein